MPTICGLADKLEAQVRALSSDPGASAVYSWTAFCDTDGRFLFAKAPEFLSGDVYAELLTTFFLASGSNALARRACIESIGSSMKRRSPLRTGSIGFAAPKNGRFALVPRYQILYRFTIGSASTGVERYLRAIERVAEREFAGSVPPPFKGRLRGMSLEREAARLPVVYGAYGLARCLSTLGPGTVGPPSPNALRPWFPALRLRCWGRGWL